MFEGKTDLDGQHVEIVAPFIEIESFENYFQAKVEHYDQGSTIIQEAGIFNDTDGTIFNKLKRSEYGKVSYKIDSKIARYQSRNCYVPVERVKCSFICNFCLCFRDKFNYDKIPHKEGSVIFITQGTSSGEKMTFEVFIFSVKKLIFHLDISMEKNN